MFTAYEFSRKFPGYTADNLATKGVRARVVPTFAVPLRLPRAHRRAAPPRRSTRSRPAASCSSRPSAHARLKLSVTANALLTHPVSLARSHPIVSAVRFWLLPFCPAAPRLSIALARRSRRTVQKHCLKPCKTPAQPIPPDLTPPPVLLQTADKLQVRNSMQSLRNYTSIRSHPFFLRLRWVRSR